MGGYVDGTHFHTLPNMDIHLTASGRHLVLEPMVFVKATQETIELGSPVYDDPNHVRDTVLDHEERAAFYVQRGATPGIWAIARRSLANGQTVALGTASATPIWFGSGGAAAALALTRDSSGLITFEGQRGAKTSTIVFRDAQTCARVATLPTATAPEGEEVSIVPIDGYRRFAVLDGTLRLYHAD